MLNTCQTYDFNFAAAIYEAMFCRNIYRTRLFGEKAAIAAVSFVHRHL